MTMEDIDMFVVLEISFCLSLCLSFGHLQESSSEIRDTREREMEMVEMSETLI